MNGPSGSGSPSPMSGWSVSCAKPSVTSSAIAYVAIAHSARNGVVPRQAAAAAAPVTTVSVAIRGDAAHRPAQRALPVAPPGGPTGAGPAAEPEPRPDRVASRARAGGGA